MDNVSTDVKLYISEYVPEQNTDEFIGIEDLYHMIKSIDPSFSLIKILRDISHRKSKRTSIDNTMKTYPLYDLYMELYGERIKGEDGNHWINFENDGLYFEGMSGDKNEITDILDKYGIPYETNAKSSWAAPRSVLIADNTIVSELEKLDTLNREYISYM